MIGRVHQAAVDGLQNRVRLAADRHRPDKIFPARCRDIVENNLKALFPATHQVWARVGRRENKFLVAIAIRLFTVCREEVSPAGTQDCRPYASPDEQRY